MLCTMRILSALCFTAAFLSLSGCVTPGEGPQPNRVSTEQEIEIGKQMAAEVEKSEKRLNNPAIQTYVRKIGERLAAQSPRQDVPYEFTVIDNPETINAFALPGGHMYVYTGLMKLCDNEAQLASVMAHEIGHVAAHHHGETITRQMNAELIRQIVGGQNKNELGQLLGSLIGTGASMWFSRAQEREADQLGMDFLFRAGYKPEAMVDFMRKMAQYEQAETGGAPQPKLLQFFASHPATTERIANLDSLCQTYPVELRNQSPTYADRYVKTVLTKLK